MSSIKKTKLACIVTAALCASISPVIWAAEKIQTEKPNVIMILLDDTGFADIGAFGSEIHTPNIDSLAQQGVRYNRFDTASMCAPTRAGLMTGRNPQTVHMEELPPKGTPVGEMANKPLGSGPANSGEMPTNAQTLAQALHSVGYGTHILGKWHIAPEYKDAPERNQAFWPLQRGFDSYYGFLSGHTSQYNPALVKDNAPVSKPDNADYHLTTDLIDHAVDIMDEKSDKPKFLYLALGAAHSPYHVPKSYIDAYKGKYDKGWDALREERFARQKQIGIIPSNTVLPSRQYGDAAWNSLDAQQKRVYSRFMETYAGFLTHTDEQIGRLIKNLKDTGQYDNTLIMFMTDNGAAPEGGVNGGFRHAYGDTTTLAEMDKNLDEVGGPNTDMLYQRPWAYAGSTPFVRYKLWPNLGGIRTPLIASWPTHIKDGGAIRNQYVNIVDIAPTILDVAGTEFATEIAGVKQIPVAGKSIKATFTSSTAPTRDTQYFELRGNRAITQGDWRAVAMHKLGTDFSTDKWKLFNVASDFSESQDLSAKYPEKVEELKKLWWEEAKRYSNPQVIEPVEFFYKYNRMADGLVD